MPPGTGATLDSIRILWELGVIGALTDAELLDRFLADSGDASETAFAILVERHGPAVRRVCLDVLSDPHDAQDAAQAVFLVLARRARSIRKPGALGSWLHGVALRVARRALAENARRREVERQAVRESAVLPAPPPCPELHEELDRLPEKYRAPIVLCYLEGQTQEQAARSLGWPLGTVQTRLHRGRQTLHGRLVRRGIVPAGLAAAGLDIPRAVAAPIAASWIRATARAAARFAARESLADLVPASISALAQGVLTTLFRSTLKFAAVGLFAASLGVIGVGMVVRAHGTGNATAPPELRLAQAPAVAPPKPKEKPAPKPRFDEISGVVVDEAGRPVQGAEVRNLFHIKSDAKATTAEDGSFRLPLNPRGVIAGDDQPKTLIASVDGGRLQGSSRSPSKHDRKIVVKPPREILVRAEDSKGQPVPQAKIEAFEAYEPITAGETGNDGVARLHVPAEVDVYNILGIKAGVGFDYFYNYHSSVIPSHQRLPAPENVRLVLDGDYPLAVRVVGPDDKPLSGIVLGYSRARKPGKLLGIELSNSEVVRTTSGPDGIARTSLDWIKKADDGGATILVKSKTFELERTSVNQSDHNHPYTIHVKRIPKALISGRVLAPDGKPSVGIPIQAEGQGTNTNVTRYYAFSDDDGRYSLDVRPGYSYMLAVISPEWAAPSKTGFLLKDGQARTGLEFSLSQGTLIRGRVVTSDGKPAGTQTVRITELGPKLPLEWDRQRLRSIYERTKLPHDREMLTRFVTTDAEGRYALRVGPGEFWIKGPYSRGPEAVDVEVVQIETQDSIERDFRLKAEPPEAEFSGMIKRPDGQPLKGVVIRGWSERPILGSSSADRRIDLVTDANGVFRIQQRSRIPILFHAHTLDNSLAGAKWVEANQDNVEITLGISASAHGRVVDLQGRPQVGARVLAYWSMQPPKNVPPKEGLMLEVPLTDEQGRYVVDGLPVGATCRFIVLENRVQKEQLFDIQKSGIVEVKDIVLGASARKLD